MASRLPPLHLSKSSGSTGSPSSGSEASSPSGFKFNEGEGGIYALEDDSVLKCVVRRGRKMTIYTCKRLNARHSLLCFLHASFFPLAPSSTKPYKRRIPNTLGQGPILSLLVKKECSKPTPSPLSRAGKQEVSRFTQSTPNLSERKRCSTAEKEGSFVNFSVLLIVATVYKSSIIPTREQGGG